MCLCVTDWSHARGKPRRLHPRCCDQWDGGEPLQQTQVRTEHTCCVSVQGLHPLKDPTFAVFEGESFRETLLTSRFLPLRPAKVTIYATRCRHFLSFFLLFLGVQRILGHVRPRRFVVVHPPKTGRRRSISDVIGLQMLLWRMQTLNWDTATVAAVVECLCFSVTSRWQHDDITLCVRKQRCEVMLHSRGGFTCSREQTHCRYRDSYIMCVCVCVCVCVWWFTCPGDGATWCRTPVRNLSKFNFPLRCVEAVRSEQLQHNNTYMYSYSVYMSSEMSADYL